jgi:hypothetical protein
LGIPPSATAKTAPPQTEKPVDMHLPPAPPIHEGMNYAVVRRIIIKHNWKPWHPKNDMFGMCTDHPMPDVCKKFPEIDDCTGRGPLFCRLQFYKGNGKLIIIMRDVPKESTNHDNKLDNKMQGIYGLYVESVTDDY